MPSRKARARPKTSRDADESAGPSTKHLLVRVNWDVWRTLKDLSADKERPLQVLMLEAVDDLLRKYGMKPVTKKKEG